MSKTVSLQSIGCRTNQQEITELSLGLAQAGFTVVDGESADIVIINTCCVTATAEAKTRRAVQSIIRSSPGSKVLVTGCYAQRAPERFRDAHIAWVVGNTAKADIPSILGAGRNGEFIGDFAASAAATMQPLSLPDNFAGGPLTRYPVKIQEGCDFGCAYCIVPSVRGPSRCVDAERLQPVFRKAVELGCKEIVLTGTHIGQYRSPGCGSLTGLIERILAIQGDFRIRLSSLDPRDVSPALLALIGTEPRVCNHAHVSVQSLDNGVLKDMHRPYENLENLISNLAEFKSRFPGAALGADFICGFPGETDKQFQTTVDRAGSIGFTYGHVFPFSKRPGTPASALADGVPAPVKTERCRILRGALDTANRCFHESQAGSVQRIIVEETDPVRGTTSNYLRTEVTGNTAAGRNSWFDVRITGTVDARRRYCRATIIENRK